jgi:hypothetical protein
MNSIWHIFVHPIVALILTITFAAIALTGKYSMLLSRVLLFIAWGIATIAILRTSLLPDSTWTIGVAIADTLGFIWLGTWVTRHDVPKIMFDRYYCEMAKFVNRPQIEWWAMHLKLLNDSKSHKQHGEPANVTARISFYNDDGPEPKYLFHMYGRWADGTYPTAATPKATITPTTFPIGFTRDLDICLKYPQETDCFGVNNESF